MPSLMVHLITAFKYDPNSSIAFLVGNVAPDSVSGWKEKDRSHFRDRPDRLNALRELAQTLDLSDDYSKGVLLHLFLDYYWDSGPMRSFIENNKEGNWFPKYRHEIALSSGWLYHHKDWSKRVWDQIIANAMSVCGDVHGLIKEDIAEFIIRNGKWHEENDIGPSTIFTPEFVEEFTSKIVVKFKDWL